MKEDTILGFMRFEFWGRQRQEDKCKTNVGDYLQETLIGNIPSEFRLGPRFSELLAKKKLEKYKCNQTL